MYILLLINFFFNTWLKPTAGSAAAENQLQTIAFGSCNDVRRVQPLWRPILQNDPDLWIWLGDNIYGDTDDMRLLREKYQKQKQQVYYQELLKQVPVIGIWDDHDYGRNDAGKEFAYKQESKELLLEFLDVPADAPVRKHEGAYQSYTYGTGNKKIKVILLDGRYFRDPINLKFGKIKFKNKKGDMLGEAQWQWLEEQLTNSDAAIHVIGSGVQVIPNQNQYEKWANFPEARNRLFNLIEKTDPSGVIFISGDMHLAELSLIKLPDYPYPIYELTSSGLTHHRSESSSNNPFRVSKQVAALNFGLLKFNWQPKAVEVEMEVRGTGNKLLMEHKTTFPLKEL
ncbi:MAG: alkaline phosphatase family protein [Hymenobacteraceae bacterium]|nr:alkaline phosphatase family protein [Hymenobacteraceae bacterium]MDX5395441.1 alkaline phosphatase family protein [Hymenobacteraceae bacterium]MDX5511490.1 alkaline phosphatase family protein [Hymenobacteraceae bacterium]